MKISSYELVQPHNLSFALASSCGWWLCMHDYECKEPCAILCRYCVYRITVYNILYHMHLVLAYYY